VVELTSFDLTLDIGLSAPDTFGSGAQKYSPDVFAGQMAVSMNLTALRKSLTYLSDFIAETQYSLHVLAVENEAEPKDFLSIYVPNFTLGGNTRSSPNKAGRAAVGNDQHSGGAGRQGHVWRRLRSDDDQVPVDRRVIEGDRNEFHRFLTIQEQTGERPMSDTDHEATVRGAAQALHDVIRDAEAAGYRVTYPGSLHDLPKIAISETGRVNAPEAAGDGFDHLGKEALQSSWPRRVTCRRKAQRPI
jgi:hypothetical protein